MEADMGFGRGALLWILGVPLPIIILLALFWHHWWPQAVLLPKIGDIMRIKRIGRGGQGRRKGAVARAGRSMAGPIER